jgi:hypothetical protein
LQILEDRLAPSIITWIGGPNERWSDPNNWQDSSGHPAVPGTGDTAMFNGNARVLGSHVDTTFLVDALVIQGWAGTLDVDNNLSVTSSFQMNSGDVRAAGGTLTLGGTSSWTGGALDFISGTGGIQNNGTLIIDTSAGPVLTGRNGDPSAVLTNAGTITLQGNNNLYLNADVTLSNVGTFNITGDANIAHSYADGVLANSGTLEKTGGTSTSTITSAFANSGVISLQSGNLTLATTGGTSTGGTFTVSAGSTLDLTGGGTATYQGNYTGSGAGTVLLASGTLAVTTLGATFKMPGPMFQWSGGTIDVSSGGMLTNIRGSVLNLNTANNNLVLHGPNAGMLTNQGTINMAGAKSLVFDDYPTLNNAAGATFNFTGDANFSNGYATGTLLNAGMLKKTQGTGTSTISCSFSNTATLSVSSGNVIVSGPVNQVSSGVLTAGSWIVAGSTKVPATLNIVSASFTTIGTHARVTQSGSSATFTNLGSLTTILAGGSFTLAGNASFTTSGALANSGTVTLSPGSLLTVSGNFTEASTSKLILQIGTVGSATAVGNVVTTSGTVSLGGGLSVTSTVIPAVGTSFTILDNEPNSPISGPFTGLAEGATFTVRKGTTTMTFKITYVGTDADGNQNVIITRIS